MQTGRQLDGSKEMPADNHRLPMESWEAAPSPPASGFTRAIRSAGPRGANAAHQTLTNARIVAGSAIFPGTIHLVGDRISAVDRGRSGLPSAVDFDGDFLLPGLIDVHTDNLERHLEPRPQVVWPGLPALLAHDRQVVAAGITTVFDALCVGDRHRGCARPGAALTDALAAMERAQRDGLLKAEHLLHVRCEVSTDAVVEAFAGLIEDPLVSLVSLMDHSPGGRQWRDLDRWRQGVRIQATEEELAAIFERRRQFPEDRKDAARRELAHMALCRGIPLASHDDATEAHVREAAALGVAISEFPTTREAATAARAAGMRVVMGAPNVVLGASHAGNISARSLAADGLIDGLASDYVPVSLIEACFILHQRLGIPLPEAVSTVTAAPARMVGLADRGEIASGHRADLMRVRVYEHMPIVTSVWRGGQRVL